MLFKVIAKPTNVAAIKKVAVRSFASQSTAIPTPAPAEQKTYGGKYTVTLIPGDGVGQETAASLKDVFKAANVPVEFEQYDVSGLTLKMKIFSKNLLLLFAVTRLVLRVLFSLLLLV
ncbi:unnamed protein product [Cunninghamella echinulata]